MIIMIYQKFKQMEIDYPVCDDLGISSKMITILFFSSKTKVKNFTLIYCDVEVTVSDVAFIHCNRISDVIIIHLTHE